jgi:hypothetical protein
VVLAIANEQGEQISRQVVGVGVLQPSEVRRFSISVNLVPARAAAGTTVAAAAAAAAAAPVKMPVRG